MFALALIGLCFWLFNALIGLFVESWLGAALVLLAYYALLEGWHHADMLRSESWRGGPFARFVRHWFDVEFDTKAVEQLCRIDTEMPGEQFVFACEPHAPQCLHMALGFAAHGGALPSRLACNIRVVAHTATRFIPLLRELLSIYGVVDSSRRTMEDIFRSGLSVAVVPSGVYGKEHALLDEPCPHTVTVYRHQQRFGFLALAVRHGAHIVPVLSPDEPGAYSMYNRLWRAWPFVLPIGRQIIAPQQPVRIYVGEPIETNKYNADDVESMQALAARYYKELAALAPPHYTVCFRYIED